MKVNFHGNCQGAGLQWFFDRSPDAASFTTNCIQNFRVMTGEETREQERRCVEEADILFYHATKRVFPWLETVSPRPGCVLIPISVFYNGAYFFIENANPETWAPIIAFAREHGVDAAAAWLVNEADLDYRGRWRADFDHMATKEEEEGVAHELRISDWQLEGDEWAQLLTKNHPSSLLFYHWANLLLVHIGQRPLPDDWKVKCREHPNLINLPMEDWATTAARRHLGLQWGATDYENRRATQFAKDKLNEWLNGAA